ncbi:hypothetical protein [Mycobacteroides saopaulense]|nr:hypothetical protein [Mycobacteroides saopaulense]OHT88009.1 hypothetical protein BKG68_08555 [Mycobacteroides saopaulense]OHU06351.1 hypothetical protein BKG73_22700 [Mycobacteroides saopaulense]
MSEIPEIGRFQISSCGTDATSTIAVLDTATGQVWVRQIFNGVGGDKALLKPENLGKPLWALPPR